MKLVSLYFDNQMQLGFDIKRKKYIRFIWSSDNHLEFCDDAINNVMLEWSDFYL